MGGRFSRFRNIEHDRSATKRPDETDAAKPSRFDGVETPGVSQPAAPATSAEAHLARFDRPAEDLRPVREGAESQPFLRCMSCEGDNNRHAVECIHCHANLSTPDQRAFNEQLWAGRLAQREAEQQAHAAHQAAQLQSAFDEKAEQRRVAEEMARQVAEDTRARLDGESLGSLFGRSRYGRRTRGNLITAGIAIAAVAVFSLFRAGGTAKGRIAVLVALAVIAAGYGLYRYLRRPS